MKIAIYGVSRSGKDYLIEHLVEQFAQNNMNLHHIKGSTLLNEMAQKKFNSNFKQLNEHQKETIRKDFITEASKIEKEQNNIVVDGHYAFYDEQMNFKKVFTQQDLLCYDLFFYLDTNPNDVVERMRNSLGEKNNQKFTNQDIQKWQNFEIENMTDDLLKIDKELHVIKFEDNSVLEYILDVVNFKYDSKHIAKNILSKINTDNYKTIILTDCDKTLSIEDSTSILIDKKGIDVHPIKQIFQNDRYTNYQSFLAKKYYDKLNLYDENSFEEIKEKIHLNENLIDNLKSIKNAMIIAVTASNQEIWEKLFIRYGLDFKVAKSNMIMSKFVKYFIMKEIQLNGKFVISIGDGMNDELMLKHSNKSYIIANKGKRENIQKLLNKCPNIHQLSFSKIQYENVLTENSISSVKCINQTSEKIQNYINKCKSNSEVEGFELRNCHQQLGKEIAKLIEKDFENQKFITIAMMRAGLNFALGIADYFDCPILFDYQNNITEIIKEKYNDRIIIIADAVINTGKSISKFVSIFKNLKIVLATNVLSDKYEKSNSIPIYATRLSANSYKGSKQKTISNGQGPDTGDRLFLTW